MKNQNIYDEYAINGFPCYFFTIEVTEKYNTKIEKYCENLKEGSVDLSLFQKIKRFLYIYYLDVYDCCLSMFQKANR